jgi:pimeloyl-ACP methyl ester carboxylesterase
MAAGITSAQGDTYPLAFEYDEAADDYFAVAEITLASGDGLEVTLQGGADLYFFVYTDEVDLYEGESLDEFVALDNGDVVLEVISSEDASGEVAVIPAEAGAVPEQPAPDAAMGDSSALFVDFVSMDCPFEAPPEVDVICADLTVPENRLVADTNLIDLIVAIIPARSGSPLADPIFYLEGGPGGSALAGIDSWYNSPYREDRTIILFDQRGTGFSTPSLNCPELDDGDDPSLTEACRDRLQAEGIDLTAYTSRENAADVEALRQALGYDQIDLYSISYGTRLALTVMRDYPAGIRAVVLDSVYPPNIDTDYNVTTDTYALISSMFADCAAQPDCAQAFPDLEARFYAALDEIDTDPPLVTDPESGEQYNLFAADVIQMLSTQLQRTDLVTAIPASLDAFISGDYDTYLDLATFGSGDASGGTDLAQELSAELTGDELAEIDQLAAQGDTGGIVAFLNGVFDLSPDEAQSAAQGFVQLAGQGGVSDTVSVVDPPDIDDDSEGMNWSVQCNEELSFMTLEQAQANAEAVDMPEIVREVTLDGSLSEFDACAVWPAGTADAIENEPVVSSIPTLVLTAQYDTATPPWWGELAAETLSNSYTYLFPMVGHGVIDGGSCPIGIGLAFLDDPAAEPDASCIEAMNAAFYIP